MWARAVAPVAEWVASRLWQRKRNACTKREPPTRLTQARRRKAQGGSPVAPELAALRQEYICRGCGKPLSRGRDHCAQCAVVMASERLADAALLGRSVAHTPEARAKEGEKQRQHCEARIVGCLPAIRLGSQARLIRKKFNRYLPSCQAQPSLHAGASLASMRAHPAGLSRALTTLAWCTAADGLVGVGSAGIPILQAIFLANR
jgi:hypothetical protein